MAMPITLATIPLALSKGCMSSPYASKLRSCTRSSLSIASMTSRLSRLLGLRSRVTLNTSIDLFPLPVPSKWQWIIQLRYLSNYHSKDSPDVWILRCVWETRYGSKLGTPQLGLLMLNMMSYLCGPLRGGPNFLANDDVGKSSDSGQSRWNHIVGYTSNGLYPLVICYIVIVNGD